jgi:hypothetical protein
MMRVNERLAGVHPQWGLYCDLDRFDRRCCRLALWNLALKILFGIVLSTTLDAVNGENKLCQMVA